MTSLINLMQNISNLIEHSCKYDDKFKESLVYSPECYNLNKESLFLDIGSGFGKPVFHAAFQVGCESKGIEVVPARVEFCLDFYYEYVSKGNFFKSFDDAYRPKEEKKREYDMNDYIDFQTTFSLNDLNGIYYEDALKDKNSNLYVELRINQDLIYEDSFTNLFYNKYDINKSILFLDNDQFTYGNYFVTNSISLEITALDDHLHSSICRTFNFMLNNDEIERDILISILKNDNIISLSVIVKRVENLKVLNLISYVNTMFGGSYMMSKNKHISKNSDDKKRNDIYKELLKYLEIKEKHLNYGSIDKDELLLKETLTKLTFNISEEWFRNIMFVQEDATKVKSYFNSNQAHFTHIYSYNKLMSKECRRKIAKILNNTNYKILAWYSNPRQSLKAGLKDFSYMCKFPMQSTSTEKFHVYVYIKTK
jgi:hypothetical protein